MAISLNQIYQPIHDFFIEKFGPSEGNREQFRLVQNGGVIYEENLSSFSSSDEEFSDIVNRIPQLSDDKISMTFSDQLNIDDLYASVVLNAIPFIPEGSSAIEEEGISNLVMKARADAIEDFESKYSKVRGGGIMDEFRVSSSIPAQWINRESVWEKHEFEIREEKNPPKKGSPSFRPMLLTLKMDEKQLVGMLPKAKKTTIPKKSITSSKASTRPVSKKVVKQKRAFNFGGIKASKFIMHHRKQAPIIAPKPSKGKKNKSAAKAKFSKRFHQLSLKHKMSLKNQIRLKSPSQALEANRMMIKFQYCLVRIQRGWYNENLCHIHRSWFVPGVRKGRLTHPPDGQWTHMPIAFVALRKLEIFGNWSERDKQNLKDTVSIGPFEVKPEGTHEKIKVTREGIQIIGWFLQPMPMLPPEDSSS